MPMNLRLPVEVEDALRAETERAGRSQQQIVREALDWNGATTAQPLSKGRAHLASALQVDADVVLTCDDRLAEACTRNGLVVAAPGTE